MGDKISREEVRKVAFLGRLHLTDEEIEKFTGQVGDILDYASMLDELDIAGVEPTSHVVPLKNVFREDKRRDSIPVEEVLKNAPEPLGDYFCVPKIIDESEGH